MQILKIENTITRNSDFTFPHFGQLQNASGEGKIYRKKIRLDKIWGKIFTGSTAQKPYLAPITMSKEEGIRE